VHDHLEEGDGRDADILEMVGVGSPWLCISDGSLFGGIVGVEGIFLRINELDVVVELCLWKISIK
jgi:hypothetical protein